MGLFTRFTFHARNRDGSDRNADHTTAQIGGCERIKQFGSAASLGLCLLANASHAEIVRVAYFHTELSRDGPGLLLRDILKGDAQVLAVLSVLDTIGADVVVLADFDFDLHGTALGAFSERLGRYPYRYQSRPNRGLWLNEDLDADGIAGEPEDAEGFAHFAGQGGLAVLSKFPVQVDDVKDYSSFPWTELPENIAPTEPGNPTRLSTTAHWDVPIRLPSGADLHILTWHATAPVFDGIEDRNGRRNNDETAFWTAYLDNHLPFAPPKFFVLAGTANADPFDGEGRKSALKALLAHPLIQDPRPASEGGPLATKRDAGVNELHRGPPELDTVDWPDLEGGPGNLRVDYVFPAAGLAVVAAGVLWPAPGKEMAEQAQAASRHRLIWVDIDTRTIVPEP